MSYDVNRVIMSFTCRKKVYKMFFLGGNFLHGVH